MLAWLKRTFGPKRIADPDLGSLLYMGGYWEGAGTFTPTGDKIEWFVDGPREGPGESQRRLFRAIGERYAGLLPAVHAALARYIAELDSVVARQTPVSELVRLAAIAVPASESPTMEWEISFDSTLKGTPHFAVAMRGRAPTGEVDVST